MSALKNSKIGTKLNTLMITASIVWVLLQSFLTRVHSRKRNEENHTCNILMGNSSRKILFW